MYIGYGHLCVCLRLFHDALVHHCTDLIVTLGNGKGCPLVVHYWAVCDRCMSFVAMTAYTYIYSVSPKKWPPFYFLTNPVKNKPMWIIFGTQNPEEFLHKCFWTCPPHLKNVATVPREMLQISRSTAAASGHALRAWNRTYFFTNKNIHCS